MYRLKYIQNIRNLIMKVRTWQNQISITSFYSNCQRFRYLPWVLKYRIYSMKVPRIHIYKIREHSTFDHPFDLSTFWDSKYSKFQLTPLLKTPTTASTTLIPPKIEAIRVQDGTRDSVSNAGQGTAGWNVWNGSSTVQFPFPQNFKRLKAKPPPLRFRPGIKFSGASRKCNFIFIKKRIASYIFY